MLTQDGDIAEDMTGATAGSYSATAPVTPSFMASQPETLAFQKPTASNSLRQRHHIRIWRSDYTSPDGRPIWVVRLTAFDTNTEQGSSESIWVEVVGDKPELTTDELVQIDGLVFAPWISGPANPIPIPPPLQAPLLVITLFVIVGEEFSTAIPPPSPKFGLWKPAKPLVMVKPFNTEAAVSLLTNRTTVWTFPPSMVVTALPFTLVTVIALPLKLMFSTYVPSETRTVSPSFAASIPPWIVG